MCFQCIILVIFVICIIKRYNLKIWYVQSECEFKDVYLFTILVSTQGNLSGSYQNYSYYSKEIESLNIALTKCVTLRYTIQVHTACISIVS